MTAHAHTVQPHAAGTHWKQTTVDRKGKAKVRIIEIIAAPTLSSSVGFRVLRNDLHPHRVGKTGSIRRAQLTRNYEAA